MPSVPGGTSPIPRSTITWRCATTTSWNTYAEDQQSEVESLVQLHFSAVAHRTNEIMRVLTVVSAIFLPLSFVAGVFGMNFEIMPGLKHPYGYFIALGGMAVVAVGLLVLFRVRRWI